MSGSDEGNAFTSVETPRWMWSWTATPPLRAADLWPQLDEDLQARVEPGTWIHPLYRRLAMGPAHPVHIPMTINLTKVGTVLCCSMAWHSKRMSSQAVGEHFGEFPLKGHFDESLADTDCGSLRDGESSRESTEPESGNEDAGWLKAQQARRQGQGLLPSG